MYNYRGSKSPTVLTSLEFRITTRHYFQRSKSQLYTIFRDTSTNRKSVCVGAQRNIVKSKSGKKWLLRGSAQCFEGEGVAVGPQSA